MTIAPATTYRYLGTWCSHNDVAHEEVPETAHVWSAGETFVAQFEAAPSCRSTILAATLRDFISMLDKWRDALDLAGCAIPTFHLWPEWMV
jgi:hypothetical protein